MQWGSVADWVAALGGVLAVVAAVVAWHVSQRLLELERERDRVRAAAATRAQAELVFVLGAKLSQRGDDEAWGIYLYNGSDKPIYGVHVESQRIGGGGLNPPLSIGALPPGNSSCRRTARITGVRSCL